MPNRSTAKAAQQLSPVAQAILALQASAGNAAVAELFVQREGPAVATKSKFALDTQAQAIVDAAQAKDAPENERAVKLVWAIINTYHSDKKDLIESVVFVADEKGLHTTPKRKDKKSEWRGTIEVGSSFLKQALARDGFSRRVLQVGHEIEHVEQHRQGMVGPEHYHEREFLAFYHEGIAPLKPGTGRIAHATRVDVLDQAIRHYNTFSKELKERYAAQYKDILARRVEEQKHGGNDPTDPPTDLAPDSD